MGFISQILGSVVHRLDEMISTLWGFVIACAIGLFNFFAGYKVALVVVLTAVIFDGIWGIAAARRQHKFALSELMRDTVWRDNTQTIVKEVEVEKPIAPFVKWLAWIGAFAVVWVLVKIGLWVYRKFTLKV